jgi:hypothetical protein
VRGPIRERSQQDAAKCRASMVEIQCTVSKSNDAVSRTRRQRIGTLEVILELGEASGHRAW